MNSSRQILLTWDIHYACNYRCPYCWFKEKWHNLARQHKYLPIEEILNAWIKVYKNYGSVHISIVGGEPFIYPNFKKLIKELSKIHFIEIATNLSVNIDSFVKGIDPGRINIISTFHPLFANFDIFIRNLSIIKEKGINNSVSFLAYPAQIPLINYYREKFDKYGIALLVSDFWGEYKGIRYPQGYTRKEKNIILGGSRDSKPVPRKIKGKLCRAGQVYAAIEADGSVVRCPGSHSKSLGNLFKNDFKLLRYPLACQSGSCLCDKWEELLIDTDRSIVRKREIEREFIPPNRVFITWDIHYGCNYNCIYCNTPKPWNPPGAWGRNRDKVVYLEADKWLRIWREIYKKYGSCEIHITGGEPFIYPSFLELIKGLAKIHTLEIITNLHYNVENIINNVTPERVRIGTTFHPEFVSIKEFLNKHIILRRQGFETWANFVAYPAHLEKMAEYKKEFDNLGISFNIQPFMGHFQKREYPKGYTDKELSYLKGCYESDDIVNKKTIEWKTGTEYKTTKDKPCRMGQMYAKIYPNGDAYRCCAETGQKLGNLIDGTFGLLTEALPCDSDLCYCWRCMLVEKESGWSQHWVIPKKVANK